jgi:hypothetical protein
MDIYDDLISSQCHDSTMIQLHDSQDFSFMLSESSPFSNFNGNGVFVSYSSSMRFPMECFLFLLRVHLCLHCILKLVTHIHHLLNH